jgi:hypothetical protein
VFSEGIERADCSVWIIGVSYRDLHQICQKRWSDFTRVVLSDLRNKLCRSSKKCERFEYEGAGTRIVNRLGRDPVGPMEGLHQVVRVKVAKRFEVFEFAGVVILLAQSSKEFEGNTILFAGKRNKEERAQLVLGT